MSTENSAAAVIAAIESGAITPPSESEEATSAESAPAQDSAAEPPPAETVAGADSEPEASTDDDPEKPATPPAKPDPLAPKFAALARKEKHVVAREQEIKRFESAIHSQAEQARAAIAEERAGWAKERAQLETLRGAKTNKQAFFDLAEQLEIDASDLAAHLVTAGSGPSKMERELAAMKAERAAEKAENARLAEEAQRARASQSRESLNRRFLAVATAEKYPEFTVIPAQQRVEWAWEEARLAREQGIDLNRVSDEMMADAVASRAREYLTAQGIDVEEIKRSRVQRAAGSAANAAGVQTENGSGHLASKPGAITTLTNQHASEAASRRDDNLPREERVERLAKRLSQGLPIG